MILLVFSFVFLICGLVLFYKANQIKIKRNEEQEKYKNQLNIELNDLKTNIYGLTNLANQKKEQINTDLLHFQQLRKKELDDDLQHQIQIIQLNVQKADNQAQKEIEEIHKDLSQIRQSAFEQKKQINNELNNLRASLSAGVQARLREQEKKEKINFYKLSVNESDLSDIKMLENLKSSFHKPVVLSKLIWTQYFQKQMTELCDRVFGKKTICGIYKITDLITEQCYIGQSVNVQDRMKQHCKCGLGIQAPATNKLYNTMQKDKVWNFTFELLEECPKEKLNEKERFWIQMYQSDKFGLNLNAGIKNVSKN